ncbi:MAG: site-2 protease family protein [Oscillospiraceae bacterium]|nr:site-2 protease family protein [Oscillospiraceae bacterium]
MEIGAAAPFVAALLSYLLRPEELLALLLAVLAHELGHLVAIRAQGLELRRFRVGFSGFCMDWSGMTGAWGRALVAASGPAAGLLYAWAASRLGVAWGRDWLCLSAGLSLLLSFFNLLPAWPLDGGQLLAVLAEAVLGPERGERLTGISSLLTATLILIAGLRRASLGGGAAAALAGAWLLFQALWGLGLVKRGKIR